MLLFPNAKINLGLYITEKRNDGFHNLETIFLPIGLCDVLEFVESDTFKFTSSLTDVNPREGKKKIRGSPILLMNASENAVSKVARLLSPSFIMAL